MIDSSLYMNQLFKKFLLLTFCVFKTVEFLFSTFCDFFISSNYKYIEHVEEKLASTDTLTGNYR